MDIAVTALIRAARLAATVFIIATLVFFVTRMIPGDPAMIVAGMDSPIDEIASIRHALGTDRPIVLQYFEWLAGVARLDFGTSLFSGRPVTSLILERLPLTLELAGLATILSIVIGVPLGVVSAVRRRSIWDWFGSLFSQLGMAIPAFWLGILLLLVFAVALPIFPLFGSEGSGALVLPSIALATARAAILTRVTRQSMIDELGSEYVVTARSKGLSEASVRYKHALRNALLPVLTVTGIQFGYLLGGAIIIEQVFSLPGLGRLLLSAVYQRDFPLIQGGVLFTSFLFCAVNFLVDFLYILVNPRMRLR